MRDGTPVAVHSKDGSEPLGDLIAGDDAERRASLARSFDGPIGRAAVVRGIASAGAVSDALRRQMRGRLARWFDEPIRSVRFVHGRVGRAPFEEPPTAADLVLAALRRSARRRPTEDLAGLLDKDFLPSPTLRTLEGAALAPWESALVARVRTGSGRGVPAAELIEVAGDPALGLRTLHGWSLLGWLTTADVARRDHSLLLRKRHQLRRRATPARLLDLSSSHGSNDTDASPRRALRRLAAKVHPDRFEPSLAETSEEVLRALVAAADALER